MATGPAVSIFLEDNSEEELLRTVLEISKQDVGPYGLVRPSDSHGTTHPGPGATTQEEEYKIAIEVSKKELTMTEEEKTNLAIIQSLSCPKETIR